jgi:hypothetical protein
MMRKNRYYSDWKALQGLAVLLGVPGIPALLRWTGIIDWSWWWALAPFWIGLLFVIIVCVLGLLAGLGSTKYEYRDSCFR